MKSFLIFFPLMVIMVSGCKDNSQLTEPESSPDITLMNLAYKAGQTFSLELDLNADAGFSWYQEYSDPAKIRLDSVHYRPKVPSVDGRIVVGGVTVETFYFQALKAGRCVITLKQAQGWVKNVPPIQTILLNVTINN